MGDDDVVRGAAGDDQLYGETGPDEVEGGPGNDMIDGGSGDDHLDGGAGNDAIIGGFGHDTLIGDLGDDTLDGGAAPDHINGGPGSDTIHGGSGPDTLNGGPGDDPIYSETGADVIDASDGNDTVYVNSGSAVQSVDCGAGEDTIFINPANRPGGISNQQALREGRIRNCEHIIDEAAPRDPTRGISWSGTGTKHGTESNDRLLGGHGSDKLYGEAGDDLLWGDARHDSGGALPRRERVATAVALRAAGESVRSIAEQLGVHLRTAHRYLAASTCPGCGGPALYGEHCLDCISGFRRPAATREEIVAALQAWNGRAPGHARPG